MFYDKFLNLCNEKGVKPSKVAVDTGFNKGSVSVWKKKYEEGIDVNPTTEILNKISDYFNVTVDYLIGKTEERKPVFNLNEDNLKFALWQSDAYEADDEMIADVREYAKMRMKLKKQKKSDNNDK